MGSGRLLHSEDGIPSRQFLILANFASVEGLVALRIEFRVIFGTSEASIVLVAQYVGCEPASRTRWDKIKGKESGRNYPKEAREQRKIR